MDLHVILLVFFVCYLLRCQNEVEGVSKWRLSKEEDLELEKQLQFLNKPAIKTIYTEYGVTYDCIDFHQQPAFDHPLLKDQSFRFEMKSEASYNKTRDQESSKFILDVDPEGEGCPVGTVLIRRVTKEDLVRHRFALKLKSYAYPDSVHPFSQNMERSQFAISRTNDTTKSYMGAGASVGIYNPGVIGRDYSASRVMLRNGPDSIEAGWRVDRMLHDDDRTYLYILTIGNKTRCFNIMCPGFVVSSGKIAIDQPVPRVSRVGEISYDFQVDIVQEPFGDWKLRLGPSEDKLEAIGYWPHELFTDTCGLTTFASYIDWGGEVFSESHTPNPAMGISLFPTGSTLDSSYIKGITYRYKNGEKVDADDVEPFADLISDYKVIDVPKTSDSGHVVLYGGPGGSIGN